MEMASGLAVSCKLVAQHAVQCRQHGLALRCRSLLARQRRRARQQGIGRAACQPRHALDAAVDKACDAAAPHAAAARHAVNKLCAQRPKRRGDSFVHIALHGFSQAGDAQGGLRRQLRQPLNVGDMQPGGQQLR
jgi:hypothetical protein